ncbi:DUF6362 family protein [Magnetospirillum sp. SS-4]|uniref:DUF6362 family protein n=1 Tax=Magnetospirillum sp. SS-4 TaxID=2681465 RepID=UPI00138397E0|nr:DUF6362 family protein [Magnetospirillum sp. SS-4]CAA7614988.1 conserved hypothetical protein [Magnetospirillum sp. SS-4]
MNWTPSLVEDRLAEAADTLHRLPETRVQGHASTWPPYIRESWSTDEVTLRRPPPSAAAITRMDETLPWLQLLDPVDAKIVWARADGKPWKVISWEVGMTRSAAHRHWLFALCVIAWKLNGHRIPKHITKAELIARTRAAANSQPTIRRTKSEMTQGGMKA